MDNPPASANGGGGAATVSDGWDAWLTSSAETMRDLTVGPMLTGVVQGFVAVALRRRRERREAAAATVKTDVTSDQ